jgi:hypothetical protein
MAMPDVPDHFPMEVDARGRGPADPEEACRVVCWCGQPECREFLAGDLAAIAERSTTEAFRSQCPAYFEPDPRVPGHVLARLYPAVRQVEVTDTAKLAAGWTGPGPYPTKAVEALVVTIECSCGQDGWAWNLTGVEAVYRHHWEYPRA